MSKLHDFLQRYPIKHYKKGALLLKQDSVPPSAFVIKKGVIKTHTITPKGEEKPIGFCVQDEIFPSGWVFGKICRSQYNYEALCDSDVYTVPVKDFVSFLKQNADIMYHTLEQSIAMMLCNQMRINALGQSKASDKVLHTIHYFALCFGRDLKPNIVEIPLPLTQQDLANFTGLTRETISVELKKLAHEKAILYRHRNYVVLTDRLHELLNDGYEHHLVRESQITKY